MKKITLIFLLLLSQIGISQETCLVQRFNISIEEASNIPSVVNNSDNTVTLVHSEQYITDIFSNYTIYSFEQAFPEATSDALLRWYTVECESKSLINELYDNVPTTTFFINNDFEGYAISQTFKDFFDGQRFRFSEFNSTSDLDPCTFGCPLDPVPNDFELLVDFSYDAQNDVLVMTTTNATPCGTEFRFSFKERSSTPGEGLVLWESEKQECFDMFQTANCITESTLYSSLFTGPSSLELINGEDFKMTTLNGVFGEDNILFTREVLSVDRFSLEKEIQIHPNPLADYIHIKADNAIIRKVSVFNLLGKQVITSKGNTKDVNVSQLQSGIYLCRIETERGTISRKIIKK